MSDQDSLILIALHQAMVDRLVEVERAKALMEKDLAETKETASALAVDLAEKSKEVAAIRFQISCAEAQLDSIGSELRERRDEQPKLVALWLAANELLEAWPPRSSTRKKAAEIEAASKLSSALNATDSICGNAAIPF